MHPVRTIRSCTKLQGTTMELTSISYEKKQTTHQHPGTGGTRILCQPNAFGKCFDSGFLSFVHVARFAQKNPRLVTTYTQLAILNGCFKQ